MKNALPAFAFTDNGKIPKVHSYLTVDDIFNVKMDLTREKCKIFFKADGFKLNLLMEIKLLDHIPLIILASVGQGKWEENRGR